MAKRSGKIAAILRVGPVRGTGERRVLRQNRAPLADAAHLAFVPARHACRAPEPSRNPQEKQVFWIFIQILRTNSALFSHGLVGGQYHTTFIEAHAMSSIGTDAAIEPASVRYHGMDALRAWAMSMGIVLHAAWIMIPAEAGAPMTDASASGFAEYICLAIHTFRMQLFFVLAGLFACLLLRKRGLGNFAKNRMMRIVLPLVVFWLILCPIMMWQYNAAGIASGAIQGGESAWDLTKTYFASVGAGSAMLIHLWFLYYLCWAYVVVLAVRGLASIFDPNRKVRDSISAIFGSMITKQWSLLILAGIFGAMMMPMKGSWGLEIEFASLYSWRQWPGLLTYVSYFVVGWLIFRNIDRLNLMLRAWRWQLAAGLLLTVPYYFYSKYVSQNGYSTWNYPQLVVEDLYFKNGVPAYPELRERMLDAVDGSIPAALYASLPKESQTFLKEHGTASQNQINGLLASINKSVLVKTEFTEQVDLSVPQLQAEAASIALLSANDRTAQQNQLLNRALIDYGFHEIVYSEDVHRPYYYPIRTAYCFCYSLTTWLLIFGCIGFSQHHFDRESKFWRYFSDSSYWFYLAHLPIQFQILLWLGDKPWHPIVKFSVYVVGTIAVLLPSYHFLVRPTWIGWLLNGRMASVWNRPAKEPALSVPIRTRDDESGARSTHDVKAPVRASATRIDEQSPTLTRSNSSEIPTVTETVDLSN